MRKLLLLLVLLASACSGSGNPPPHPSPSPSPTPPPACTSKAVVPRPQSGPAILRPRGFPLPSSSAGLTYNGGPVLLTPKVYLVFWQMSATDPVAQREMVTFTNVGGSQWANTTTQYCQKPNVYITNPAGELQGVWSDMTDPIPHSAMQADIAAEAKIAADHFAVDVANASVVVAFPQNANPSGFLLSYCAWHAAVPYHGGELSYTNLPYIPNAGKSCGENFVNGGPAGALDGVSIVAGHELAESITDPVPPQGWSGEIGDLCAWSNKTANESLNGVSLPMQPLWSNQDNGCKQ